MPAKIEKRVCISYNRKKSCVVLDGILCVSYDFGSPCRLDSRKCLQGRYGVKAAGKTLPGAENSAASTAGSP